MPGLLPLQKGGGRLRSRHPVTSLSSSPAQDTALSRRKHGFDSHRGRQQSFFASSRFQHAEKG